MNEPAGGGQHAGQGRDANPEPLGKLTGLAAGDGIGGHHARHGHVRVQASGHSMAHPHAPGDELVQVGGEGFPVHHLAHVVVPERVHGQEQNGWDLLGAARAVQDGIGQGHARTAIARR